MSTFLNASPIFGPVRSRRLGLSLGVNMMPASGKICTFDCIYCENGLNAERPCHEPYNTAAVVLDALEAKLREMAAEGELPDVITFAGNGEPTAAPEFPQAIAGAVALRDQLAVLCDGTVVPCCLDGEGELALGNLFRQELEDILRGERAAAIHAGFDARRPAEELCRRCGYAERFTRG